MRFLVIMVLIFLSACTLFKPVVISQNKDNKYDSEYPQIASGRYIKEIMESVKVVSAVAYYNYYQFSEEAEYSRDDIRNKNLKKLSVFKSSYNKPSTGTATIIYNENNKVALLTRAHVVYFADTIWHYYDDQIIPGNLKAVAVKESQMITVLDVPQVSGYEIIAADQENDIALIGRDIMSDEDNFKKLSFPLGRAAELDWGNFVYVISCPVGKKMISDALISQPLYLNKHKDYFLIDAVVPRGSSGGLVFALRDGIPNLELVGIIRSIAAQSQHILTPDESYDSNQDFSSIAYQDEIRVKRYDNIYYGLTYVTPVELIIRFLREYRAELEEAGYYFDDFSE